MTMPVGRLRTSTARTVRACPVGAGSCSNVPHGPLTMTNGILATTDRSLNAIDLDDR